MNNLLISIVVPICNGSLLIVGCLNSILYVNKAKFTIYPLIYSSYAF